MDPLDRFSAALATEHDGEVAAPGVTRSRILERLIKRRAPRSGLRTLWAIPFVLLGAGTALAASGRMPLLLSPLTHWFVGEAALIQRRDAPMRKPAGTIASVPPASDTAPAPAEPPIEPAALPADVDLLAPEGVARASQDAAEPAEPGRRQLAVRSETTISVPDRATPLAENEPPPAQVASEPGLALYTAAQRAHFRAKDCGTAVRLYESYLESAPSGAFATEARYNRSLCLLRLGRTAEARPVLSAFARGAYGDYRKVEATRVLDATAE